MEMIRPHTRLNQKLWGQSVLARPFRWLGVMFESETYFFRHLLLNVRSVDQSINIFWEMTRDAGSQAYLSDLLNQNLLGNWVLR